MAGTGVGKFSSTASNNTSNLTVNFAENMAPSNVNNAARELMGHMRDMYEQLGDGYFEFGDGDGEYTVTRGDADTITITGTGDITSVYYVGRKIRITDGGANVVEGVISGSSHSSTTQTIDLSGISLASGAPTKVELGIDTAAFGGKVILDDDGDTYIEAPTDDTIDIYVAGAKDFVITANTFTAESGSTIAAQALTATSITSTGNIIIPNAGNIGSASDTDAIAIASDGVVTLTQKLIGTELDISGNVDVNGTTNLDVVDIDGAVDMASTLLVSGSITTSSAMTITTTGNETTLEMISTDADANSGPRLSMNRQSGSPADGDDLGKIFFFGKNDAAEDQGYAEIMAEISDASDGTEDGRLVINMRQAGATTEAIRFEGSNGVVVNEGSADVDFRVESADYTHAFHVNAANNSVSIGAIERSFGLLHVTSGASNCGNANSAGDEFIVEVQNSIDGGMSILTDQTRTANIFFGDQGSNSVGGIAYDHSTNAMEFNCAGNVGFKQINQVLSTRGESSPDVSAGGICLNQGANDTKILSFKSSDIAHGITGEAETDTYAEMGKLVGASGGLHIKTYSEDVYGLYLEANQTNENTATSTSAIGNVHIKSLKKSGTGRAAISADGNIFVVANSGTEFIVKGDGELFSNQSGTVGTFDTYEDAQLVRAYDLSSGRYNSGLIDSKFDEFVQYNAKDLADANLIGKEEDGTPNTMVNITGMQRLHNGAIWQQYEKHQNLANAMYELAKVAVGEDKANEILKQNEIKLLN